MKILLLSAYDARSHQLWRQGLEEQFPQYDWHVLTLPARHFAWRARSNAMQWFFKNGDQLNSQFDLLIATSTVDLASLRGLFPNLASTPAILYFHENQFAYPQGNSKHSTLELKIASVYSALAADEVVFNSRYNRDTFLAGAESMLKKMPDNLSQCLASVLSPKCLVLPVPLHGAFAPDRSRKALQNEPIQLVWNHRWEFDKGPDRLLAFCRELLKTQLAFVLHVVGQQFRDQPAEFAQLRSELQAQRPQALGQWGFIAKQSDYVALLKRSHFVLSTAEHDFQGLAVLEAVQAGCLPLVPNRLAYPEWIGERCLYAATAGQHASSGPDSIRAEATAAVECLMSLLGADTALPDISHLGWVSLRPSYQKLILRHGSQC